MAEAPAKLNAQAGAKPAEKKRGVGKLPTVLILLLGTGFATWWTFFRTRDAGVAVQQQVSAGRRVLPLESFTVNLADAEQGRFLRATLSLGVDGQLPAIARAESKAPETGAVSMATIRDSILSVMTTCKSEDLLTAEGKARLKTDLIHSLNRDVPALQAREVYFTDFLVQR
jgi:flagellar basal body-associated protein FliL